MVKELLEITNEKMYFDKLELNNKLITNVYLDGNSNKIADDGGFFKMESGSLSVPIKNVAENGLVVNLLIN
jgi:hypothetical protein